MNSFSGGEYLFVRAYLVFHLDEEEAGCGSGGTGGGAVSGCENRGDGVGWDTSYACFYEGSDQVADHVVEETRAGDPIDEKVFVLAPCRFADCAGG